MLLRQEKSGDMEQLINKWKEMNEYNHKVSLNTKNVSEREREEEERRGERGRERGASVIGEEDLKS